MHDPRTISYPSPRGFLMVAGQQLVGTVLGFFAWVILAQMLPLDSFGEFNAAFAVATMAGTLASLGLAQYITVPFRMAITSRRFELARGLRQIAPRCILIASLLAYGIVLVAHVTAKHDSLLEAESFGAALSMLPLIALTAYLVATANTHGAPVPAMSISVVGLQILIILGLGVAFLIRRGRFDLIDAAVIWVTAMLIVCIALWWLNVEVEDPAFKHGRRTVAWRTWVTGTAPFFLAVSVNMLLVQAPFLVLGWIDGGAEQTGLYAAADRLAQLLAVPGLAGTAMFMPPLADAIRSSSVGDCRRLVKRWLVFVGSANLAVLGGLVLFGERLLDLYGEEYVAAYPLLVVIGGSICVAMTASIALAMIQYAGRRRLVIATSAFWSIFGVLGMLVLCRWWNALGVAIAQALAFLGMYLTFVVKAGPLLREESREDHRG